MIISLHESTCTSEHLEANDLIFGAFQFGSLTAVTIAVLVHNYKGSRFNFVYLVGGLLLVSNIMLLVEIIF
jgi:hypothetical protein